jgi:hypothetical protein
MAKAAKKANSSKKSTKKRKVVQDGEHIRQLAPERAVRNFIGDILANKSRTSEAGQLLSTATKRFQDAGGNTPAARLAARLVSKAKHDSIVARVLFEDLIYYLEVMDFDKLAPVGMFTPEESGQRAKRKSKQEEMPIDEKMRQQGATTDDAWTGEPEQTEQQQEPATIQ